MTRVRSARLDELSLPLREPFVTSFGTERRRRFLVVHLEGFSGSTGLGECVAAALPLYSSETVDTARWAIRRLFLPAVLRSGEIDPTTFLERTKAVRGHRMARAAVEMSLWDLVAQERGTSLSRLLGGRRRRVEVGVSVGISPDVPHLLRSVEHYVHDGYRRVKLKVRPGWDEAPVAAVRAAHPALRLWVDANQAYPPRAAGDIARWAARFRVEQVEQPFPERAIRAHASLQRGRSFRVCLDESVVDLPSLEDALGARALRSLNVKPGRVGGHATSITLARRAMRAGAVAWVGGMLESGIGRAHNLALASLALFRWPPDLSASDRYFEHDVIDPPFKLDGRGRIEVPPGPGIGIVLDERTYRRALVRRREVTG
jgi:O-succinylbenzoate synthase